MSYIYKITNILNGKVYIGKTNKTIKERWGEHKRASIRYPERPLYRAFSKYGFDNFSIEQIEEVPLNIVDEREKYWIKYYDTYKNGYNATLGGDGSSIISHEEVIKYYQQIGNCAEVARLMNISVDSVRDILHSNHIEVLTSNQVCQKDLGNEIDQLDKKTGVLLKTFPSIKAAAMEVAGYGNGAITHIHDVCKGIRKTAYGYKWKFHE